MILGSIAGKQLVQDKLVWILSELTRGQLLCWRLGRLKEAWRHHLPDPAAHRLCAPARRLIPLRAPPEAS